MYDIALSKADDLGPTPRILFKNRIMKGVHVLLQRDEHPLRIRQRKWLLTVIITYSVFDYLHGSYKDILRVFSECPQRLM